MTGVQTCALPISQLTARQRIGKAIKLIVGVSLGNLYYEKLTGKSVKTKLTTFVPYGGNAIGRIKEAATGNKYNARAGTTPEQVVEDLIKAYKDYIKYGSARKLRKIGLELGAALFGIGGDRKSVV